MLTMCGSDLSSHTYTQEQYPVFDIHAYGARLIDDVRSFSGKHALYIAHSLMHWRSMHSTARECV